MRPMKEHQINLDWQISKYKQGVKLIAPDHPQQKHILTQHTVAGLLDLPFGFYFLDDVSATRLMNEESAEACGFDSVNDAYGRTLFDVSSEDSAKNLIDNCSTVVRTARKEIFDEENIRKDGAILQFLSLKMPWYNADDNVIGVVGCSIVLGKHSLAHSLKQITQIGLLDSQQLSTLSNPFSINNIHLTPREMTCLKLTVKGYTAKRVAKELGISNRTVEEYLTNIRIKAGASSKSELIEMTIDSFIG